MKANESGGGPRIEETRASLPRILISSVLVLIFVSIPIANTRRVISLIDAESKGLCALHRAAVSIAALQKNVD